MSALEKVLRLSAAPAEEDPGDVLSLALTVALDELRLYLASSDSDDDGDDDSGGGNDGDEDDQAGGHADHATYKALCKKGVNPKLAAKMCAKADKKVKASALLDSVYVMLSADDAPAAPEPTYLGRVVALAAPKGESASDRRSLAAKGWALEDGSYPMPDAKHVHSAAVLAASKHGDYKAAMRLIPKMAKIHGVELSSLPGFGGSSDKDEKVAATYVALAAGSMKATAAQSHPPFHGVHSHAHVHANDNMHGPGPDRLPGHGMY